MKQNGELLLKRINELLDLSRLDANKMEVSQDAVFLYSSVKTLLANFESAANLKNIRLSLDFALPEEVQLLTDKDKLEKIIGNFLSNALKFTPAEGAIQLKVEK